MLIGSADTPRTIRNPWTVAERAVMIESALPDETARLIVRPLRDHLYNESLWIAEVQRQVAEAVQADGGTLDANIGLIGMDKDASSYYLREFPQWPLEDVQHTATLSATELRRYLFEAGDIGFHGGLLMLRGNVPAPVYDMLEAFRRNSPSYAQLVAEYRFIEQYRAAWKDAPYPPTFVTTDAVVVHSGHVLLVRRRAEPGKGLWHCRAVLSARTKACWIAACASCAKKPGSSCRCRCSRARCAAGRCSTTPSAASADAPLPMRSTSSFQPANCLRYAVATMPIKHAGFRLPKSWRWVRACTKTTCIFLNSSWAVAESANGRMLPARQQGRTRCDCLNRDLPPADRPLVHSTRRGFRHALPR